MIRVHTFYRNNPIIYSCSQSDIRKRHTERLERELALGVDGERGLDEANGLCLLLGVGARHAGHSGHHAAALRPRQDQQRSVHVQVPVVGLELNRCTQR